MSTNSLPFIKSSPQCQFFVVRKKRLCRMTVRPGRQYCGEHEPDPRTEEGKDDTRIPCPYDPKHTCYASKLEKHLAICNARPAEMPPYIEHNVNAPVDVESCVRKPLSEISRENLMQVIEKVNLLFEKYIAGEITELPQRAIHTAVQQEFSEADRGESSRRHMRQASSILHLAESMELVRDTSCYVELGAGKGQLSFYMGNAWCRSDTGSSVVVVDRAALRHKRDNKLRDCVSRVRADLAHLALGRLPEVARAERVVGVAKHLCGVATDYALRCITSDSVTDKARGVVLATCCHHRCHTTAYVGNTHLQELGISGEDLNVMLGIVSWATCGDGRSRDRRKLIGQTQQHDDYTNVHINNKEFAQENDISDESSNKNSEKLEQEKYYNINDNPIDMNNEDIGNKKDIFDESSNKNTEELVKNKYCNIEDNTVDMNSEDIGKENDISDESIKKNSVESEQEKYYNMNDSFIDMNNADCAKENHISNEGVNKNSEGMVQHKCNLEDNTIDVNSEDIDKENDISDGVNKNSDKSEQEKYYNMNESFIDMNNANCAEENDISDGVTKNSKDLEDKYYIGGHECRAEVGRRAKALLDWGRVLYLREKGFNARLCYYVPSSVSPENVCLVATKPDR